MSYNQLTQHSSHLWISNSSTLEQQVITQLQHTLCNKKCTTCTTCKQITDKEHPWITWLAPENAYNIEQIDSVITATQFTLDAQEKRFFIFTQAHELTSTCCNRLLKTVEEPHAGYFFIFMTHRPQDLLPTLQSRCFIQTFQPEQTAELYQEIIQPFKDLKLQHPVQFMKMIDKQNIKESATKEIIDALIEHFHNLLKTSSQEANNKQAVDKYLDIMIILKKSLLQLPVQGSSKIFWKNLYIDFHQHIN